METIFKARTSIPGGVFIDGKLISDRWNEFVSTSLFKQCSKNPQIEVSEFKNGAYETVAPMERQEEAAPDDRQAFVERATVADLKIYLINKGYDKRDISELNKKDLINLVLAD